MEGAAAVQRQASVVTIHITFNALAEEPTATAPSRLLTM